MAWGWAVGQTEAEGSGGACRLAGAPRAPLSSAVARPPPAPDHGHPASCSPSLGDSEAHVSFGSRQPVAQFVQLSHQSCPPTLRAPAPQ